MAELLDFTRPHVLRNETEYSAAVEEIDRLLDVDPATGSEEYDRLEFLSVLVQAYEDALFPMDELTRPREVVEFMLEQKGLSDGDLQEWLGGKSNASEFLRGVRELSLRQIEILREKLGIPADLLIQRDFSTLSA